MSIATIRKADEAAGLAGRAHLACATAELCEAHRSALRVFCDAWQRGEASALLQREQIVAAQCAKELPAFLAAWHCGRSAMENMRVIEVAVHSYAGWFNTDDAVRGGIERLCLDAMRKVVRRLPDPQHEGVHERTSAGETHRAMDGLEACLEALLAAHGADRDTGGHATMAAAQAVTDAAAVAVLGHGYDLGRLQIELEWWSRATGGPAMCIQPAVDRAA